MWVHARRPTGGAASPGPGRAGFLKIFGVSVPVPVPVPMPGPVQNPTIDHWSILKGEVNRGKKS